MLSIVEVTTVVFLVVAVVDYCGKSIRKKQEINKKQLNEHAGTQR